MIMSTNAEHVLNMSRLDM